MTGIEPNPNPSNSSFEINNLPTQPPDEGGSLWGLLKDCVGWLFTTFNECENPEDERKSLEGRVSSQEGVSNPSSAQEKVNAIATQTGLGEPVIVNKGNDQGRIKEEENFPNRTEGSKSAGLGVEIQFLARSMEEEDDEGLAYSDALEGNNDSTSTDLLASTLSLLEVDSQNSPLETKVQEILAVGDHNVKRGAISSQKILSTMVQGLKAVGYQNLSLAAQLAGEEAANGYELEAYTMESAPGKVFYQIKVNYRLVADSPPSGGKREEFQFERTIYTTATTPEDALRLAMQFKEMVHEYAMKDRYDSEFDQAAISSRSFTFNFTRNGMGAMTHLNSTQVHSGTGRSQKNVERKEALSTLPKRIFFNPAAGKEWDSSWGTVPLPSYLPFDTYQQLTIYKTGFTIKQDYLELTKQRNFNEVASELKQEIKKNQERFDQLAVRFFKTPQMLNLFSKEKEPSFSDKVESLLKVTEDEDFDIEQLDENQKKQLASLAEEMAQLVRVNQELRAKKGQFESLQGGAEKVATDDNQTHEKKAEAASFLVEISPAMKHLEEINKKQEALIAKIGTRLRDVEASVVFDASEGIPLSEGNSVVIE